MIANERPVIADSLWTATANPAPDCPPLTAAVTADVAVVGAGYTGLSAALHLAQAGRRVVVLEAETPGWGASGRNGGQVNPGLYRDPDEIEARFGAEMGGRMVQMSGAAGDLVFDLIRRHDIACDVRQVGWIRAAHSRTALAEFGARVDQWQRRGAPLRILDKDETADMIGTDAYLGGLIDPRGGNLHPLNYALGLAAAAQGAGAVIHGHSRVIAMSADGDGHRLRTAQGEVRARRVLLCTNGYSDGVRPPLAQTVVPVRSIQVATAPLGDNIRRSILPGGQAASDSRRLLLYYRLDAAGRLIMGGRGAYGDGQTATRLADLRAQTRQMFPQLGPVTWQHAWGGFVAVTADHYPHLNRMGDGVMAAVGYNGRGVAMATAMGKVLGDWACGTPEPDLDFPVTDPRPLPFHGLRRVGVAATVARYRLMDALGL